jgi:preprotein translocase subunit SecY
MWEKVRIIFTIPELRQKIFLTLLLLAIYRVGYQIPLPILDQTKMTSIFERGGGLGRFLEQAMLFSAVQFGQATVFGLGIMPYISASIIFQLLASVWPPLEQLQKEGESGRKKINEYTRYATVVLCIGQSWFYLGYLMNQGLVRQGLLNDDGRLGFGWQLTAVLTMTAGTTFLMWLGEQIDEYGIGNGISLLIMAGILARLPHASLELIKPMLQEGGLRLGTAGGQIGVETVLVLVILFVAVVAGVVFITQGQRRIPTYSAKHVRGRRVFGGTKYYLPLRVNQAGVMPIIFASSLLLFPQVIFQWLSQVWPKTGWLVTATQIFHRGDSYVYNALYVVLIYFFCYFWTAISFNPKDMADNLKNHGSFIRGYRPGRPTANYLEKVMMRITYVGAGFLALVAITPTLVATWMTVEYNIASFYGGTGLLIAVSVAFDLVQKIDSHLVMRNYRGLLER